MEKWNLFGIYALDRENSRTRIEKERDEEYGLL